MDRLFRCLLVLCAVLTLVFATIEKDIYTYGSTTTIASAGYPACYPSHEDLGWRIDFGSSSGNHYIVVDSLDLEYSPGCPYDYLAFHDGSTRYDTEISKMCGVLSSSCHMTFTGRYGYVRFVTDGSNNFGGFRLTVNTRSPTSMACSSVPVTPTTPGSCRPVHSTVTTSLMAEDFSQTLQTSSDSFTHSSDGDFAWQIDSGFYVERPSSFNYDGYRVRVTVEDWALDKTSGCTVDYVMFYDGPSTSDPVYGPYCGYLHSCTFLSSGQHALITLHSRSSNHGFRMTYERYSGHSSQVMSCTGAADSASRPGSIVPVPGVLISIILSFDVAV